MHEHGPKCLDGPIRGTSGWWQELGRLGGLADVAPPPKRKRPRKRARQVGEEGSSRIRTELVERVRREIAAGAYDTPEKWEAALDRLLDHLCPE
jgi:hypothetical protein